MENARIVVFEDDPKVVKMLQTSADMTNQEIVGVANTLDESLNLIDLTEFDAAIVDGNLDSGTLDCSDGRKIVDAIRTKREGAVIVWFSSITAEDANVEIEPRLDIGKDVFGALEAISES